MSLACADGTSSAVIAIASRAIAGGVTIRLDAHANGVIEYITPA